MGLKRASYFKRRGRENDVNKSSKIKGRLKLIYLMLL